ncbi:MAG: MATE family efflux transporter [bacterium]|nr:MATE family efflux transporter [bacterium]
MNTNNKETHALDGPIIATFFRYLLPSVVGILAMTSASIIDGIFIGNVVGIKALAAVNLIMPILSLLFGVGLMLAIGGSVRGGKYLGEKNNSAASAVFSKTIIVVAIYGTLVILLGVIFEIPLFKALGANASLFPVMSEYYLVIMPFLIFQLGTIVLYFFVRLDGYPSLSAMALVAGSIVNIILDYLFIAVFGWGLHGAALATGISQVLPMLVLVTYFFSKKRKLKFSFKQSNWGEVFHSAYNGMSEFINEISAGGIAFILNRMLIQRAGVEGVAAITVVNYLLMIGFMVFFSISDTSQVMISQNYGAKNTLRIQQFLNAAFVNIALVSVLCILILTSYNKSLIMLFLKPEGTARTVALAQEFIAYIWPLFLFAGINMLFTGYLTAIHLPFQSGVVAICRSLVLPAGFLMILYSVFNDYRFVMALPVSECVTFLMGTWLFLRHRPRLAINKI